jgi:predicted aminopeptidase
MDPLASAGARERLGHRWRRRAGRALIAVVVLVIGCLTLVPMGRYLARGAWEETRILERRRAIVDVLADPATPTAVRAKLQIVVDARRFAADSVRLKTGDSFTTYSTLAHDTLVLVLSAAYKDQLKGYSWWFPVVGRVPYKGFFDFAAAQEAARQMDADGFDVYLRPSPAFSTLGWFNDPVLSTTLGSDSIDIANTVIHEVTHNTFYAPSSAVFNESFANFVGARGAAWFFRSRGSAGAAAQMDARWEDDKVLAAFWSRLYQTLDSAFHAHPDDREVRMTARAAVYASARTELVQVVGPQLRTFSTAGLERVRLDNAAVMARRIYLTDVDLFDAVWAREGNDLPRTVTQIITLARSKPKDPFGALREWLAAPVPTPPTTTTNPIIR